MAIVFLYAAVRVFYTATPPGRVLFNTNSNATSPTTTVTIILAFYSMHTLPVNYAGLALIIFGIALFLVEVKVTSHGLLAVGGAVSLFLGSIMLIRTPSGLEVVEISMTVIVASVVLTTIFFAFILTLGIRAQRLKPATGTEALVGLEGVTISALTPGGTVRVHGEIWQAQSDSGPVPAGTRIRVAAVQNLTLRVTVIH